MTTHAGNLEKDSTSKTQVYPKHNRLKRAKTSGSFSDYGHINPRHVIDITGSSSSCDDVIFMNYKGKLSADTVMIKNDRDNLLLLDTSPELLKRNLSVEGEHPQSGDSVVFSMQNEVPTRGSLKRSKLALKKTTKRGLCLTDTRSKTDFYLAEVLSSSLHINTGEDDQLMDQTERNTNVPPGFNIGQIPKHHTPQPLILFKAQAALGYQHTPLGLANIKKTHKEMRSGWRKEFTNEICSEMLEEIQKLSLQFPVHTFYSLLLKKRTAPEEGRSGFELEKTEDSKHSSAAYVHKKRKNELEEQSSEVISKRHKTNQELNRNMIKLDSKRFSDALAQSYANSRNRLSRTKCRQQQSVFCAVVTEPKQNETVHPLQDPLHGCLQGEGALWTDKYLPRQSSEVIGNSASVGQLHSWLKEWKIRADIEERRRREEERRMEEENSNESWDCGDFEGDTVSIDQEQELCNTMLIIGPSGVGKTAAVYACAQELGFKVFEVNSSVLRSGRLILSQLTEATQSHQVAVQRNNQSKSKPHVHTFNMKSPSRETAHRKVILSSKEASRSSRASSKISRPQPIKITQFFKMNCKTSAGKTSDGSDWHTHNAVKPKPDPIQESGSGFKNSEQETADPSKDPMTVGQSRTIPMSLILFEEVDVIFPEDVGFLAAIKTFMSTTKRPIILTTSDPLFSGRLKGHFDEVHFKTPSLQTIRSYLQCLCVVENMWTDPDDVALLLCQNKGDIRQSILQLQFWVCSGGGTTEQQFLKNTLKCGSWTELENCGHLEMLADRMGEGLLYSNIDSLFSRPDQQKSINAKTEREKPANSLTLQRSVHEVKPDRLSTCRRKKKKTICYSSSDLRIFSLTESNEALFPSKQTVLLACETEDVLGQDSSLKVVFRYVVCIANFFDNMSFLDAYLQRPSLSGTGLCKPEPLGWMGAMLKDSLLDLPREEQVGHCSLENCSQILAMVVGLGFHQCRTGITKMWTEATRLREKLTSETSENIIRALSLPCHKPFSICLCALCESSVVQRRKEIISTVFSSKEFCCHGNKRALSMDYLPALRSICRSERVKEQSTYRHSHYLSRLHLPSRTLRLMTLDFP
ncbi:ATPase family AAA domain-containing protein 5b [Xyrauchen texanus]|uniref:ATPase family AAA domain-containing protein 5b n=1 Tax=Xyrauchen texanus TaxID=154827 RepID=UPI002241A90E|nr:ATPase family AAA domain-containing protein 5b [Xyrauchen texanus]